MESPCKKNHRRFISNIIMTVLMKNFYGDYVHDSYLDNYQCHMEKYRRRIKNELKYFGYDLNYLKDKTVLDIGTGIQSLVFSEAGCKKIYHFDINERQVNWLNTICAKKNISNIHSKCLDISTGIGKVDKIDFAFVIGILHHLESPSSFLNSLIKSLSPSGKILLRCYRSGTWSRWLAAHLRKAISEMKKNKGPAFLELFTYRWLEHCGPYDDDNLRYRPQGEISFW